MSMEMLRKLNKWRTKEEESGLENYSKYPKETRKNPAKTFKMHPDLQLIHPLLFEASSDKSQRKIGLGK